MTKFMVLYNSTASASEVMEKATPEEVKASMQEWIKWRDESSKTAKIDFGLPLQAVSKITADGEEVNDSQVSGYSIIEGESAKAVSDLLKGHPHLKRPGASIELLEMLSIPGMDA